MTELFRVFDYNTRAIRNKEQQNAGQRYDDGLTTIHFAYHPVEFLKEEDDNISWKSYIIFDVPDDNGNPQVYEFDGYSFVLNWNITSKVIKTRRVEYQLWFVKNTVTYNDDGTYKDLQTDYLLSQKDSFVLNPSIPDKPKTDDIIDPEILDVPPNPPSFLPSVEPSIIGWIDLWKDIGIVKPISQSTDEQGRTVIHFSTFDSSETYDITINTIPLDEHGHIPMELLATGHTADTIPLIKETIQDGDGLVYSEADGGFIGGSGFDPSSYQLIENMVTSTEGWSQEPSDEKYPSEKLAKDAIDDVADDLSAHIADTSNPHQVTKAQVQLGLVENRTMDTEPIEDSVNYVESGGVYTGAVYPLNQHTVNVDNPHQVTKAQVGLGSVANYPMDIVPTADSPNYVSSGGAYDAIDAVSGDISGHIADTSNPHQVTKSQVGLGNVVNATMDNAPVEDSANYVTSGGVYSAISDVSDDISDHVSNLSNPHQVDKAQVGLGMVVNAAMDNDPTPDSQNYVKSGGVYGAVSGVQSDLDTHKANYDNPHHVTKAQVSLGDVVNAPMDNAPTENSTNYVTSGGVYSALGTVQGDIDTHEARTDNPHSVTKAQVGLGNVDNTSDANKPVSAAQQAALDTKLDDTQLITAWSQTVLDTNIASEKLTKDTLDTKLDKSSQTSKVYATDANGAQIMVDYGNSATGNSLVQRSSTGQITVPQTPVADTDAASKAFVNSSIATGTGTFMGNVDATSDLGLTIVEDPTTHAIISPTNAQISTALSAYAWSTTPASNDYCFVSMNKSSTTDVDEYRRFKFDGTDWLYEYTLNNSSFTQAQWDSINSTITAAKVAAYDAYATSKQDALVSGTNIKTINSTSLLGSGDIVLQTPLTAGTDYQTPLTAGVDYQTPLVAGVDYQTPLTAGTDYQVPLVSGTNIKTINSTSLLGSGDIQLQTPLTAGTDYQIPLVAGTDYQTPLTPGNNITIVNGVISATSSGIAEWGHITGTLGDQTDLQTALDAKVSGPVSSTDGNVALFDGATGKLIKDSGKTLGASIPVITPNQDEGKALVVNSSGTGFVYGEAGSVDDVQVNGVSVVTNKVANVTVPAQVQADWNEADTTDPSYIQNKPNIPPAVVVDPALSPTSENAIQNKAVYAEFLKVQYEHKVVTVSIPQSAWDEDGYAVVALPDVTPTNTIIATPIPASFDEYSYRSIRMTGQNTERLVFWSDGVPSNTISMNIVIFPDTSETIIATDKAWVTVMIMSTIPSVTSGGSVTLTDGTNTFTGTTDASGVALIEVTALGTYDVAYTKGAYSAQSEVTVSAFNAVYAVGMTIVPNVTVTVAVVNGAIQGRTVTFTPTGSGQTVTDTTDSSGEVTVTLPGGEYTVSVDGQYGYYTPASQTQILEEGDTLTFTYVTYLYGFAVVDIDTTNSDPATRCTYPQTVTIDNVVYNNSCYGYTPMSNSETGFSAGSWDGHRILEGIKPVSFDGTTWTDLGADASVWPVNIDCFTEFPFNWLVVYHPDASTIRVVFSDNDRCPFTGTGTDGLYCYSHVKACNDVSTQSEQRQVMAEYLAVSRNALMTGTTYTHIANSFHAGCFQASGSESGIYSKKGAGPDTMAYASYFKGANARGLEYDCLSQQQWTYLQCLFVLLFRSTNSQAVHSLGYTGGNAPQTYTGLPTDGYGMAGSISSNTMRNAFFWLHDMWGNTYQVLGGGWTDARGATTYSYGIWIPRQARADAFGNGWDATTTDTDQSGVEYGIEYDETFSGNFAYVVTVKGEGPVAFLPTSQSGGSATTYYCDQGQVTGDTIARFPNSGGRYGGSTGAGMFNTCISSKSSESAAKNCARLTYRGGH